MLGDVFYAPDDVIALSATLRLHALSVTFIHPESKSLVCYKALPCPFFVPDPSNDEYCVQRLFEIDGCSSTHALSTKKSKYDSLAQHNASCDEECDGNKRLKLL